MLKSVLLALALFGVMSIGVAADDTEKTVRDALHAISPTSKPDLVQKSELPGFYEAVVNGHVLYISADGKYLLEGEAYDVAQKTNLGSATLAKVRLAGLNSLSADKRITFTPANPKHMIMVFTDVDCPYCRQFHQQIAAINQLGIAVQYIFFPLTQLHPGADKKAVAVWCSQDRKSAYTAAMNGQDPGKKTCENPIAETLALGVKLGIGGTPTVLASNGVQVNGNAALDPKQLLAELDKIDPAPGKAPVAAN